MFAKVVGFRMNRCMKLALFASGSLALALLLSNCGTSVGKGGNSGLANTGPFDNNGNYVEEWADNPAKWRKSGGPPSPHELKSDRLPEIALNDQPPQNSVPLPTRSTSRTTSPISQTKVVAKSTRTQSTATKPSAVAAKASTKSSTKSSTKTVAATKPKAKPAAARYVVKKGDSLSAIASRNRTTVAALKSANGISGTLIRPGQALSIPKH